MKRNKRILKRKEEGITLIALVITIIVLLILAGVSIAMLTGENGILSQAQRAKEETEKAQKEEQNILDNYENDLSFYTKGVNAPVLKEGMELVNFNENTKSWETNNSSSSYDYLGGIGKEDNNTSKWANARVIIDGVESYFVWIPRYAYKITYNNTEDISAGGIIDVKFLKGTSNIALDGTVCKYADDETLDKNEDYIIHPAFTSNEDLGGWSSELTGIWVGKYEAARSDAGTTIDNPGTSTKIKVQPGVTSWINTTIGDMYDYAKEYSINLNSHMLKNSEWGAVAYLTHSQYGRNGHEIDTNDNSNFITADEGIEINTKQSSTGNVYGIYDLSGGADEYVAAYNSESTGENLIKNGSQLVNETRKEFVTAYRGTTTDVAYKLGDATYETENWNSDIHVFPNSENPFFSRGGAYSSTLEGTGIFKFATKAGNPSGGGFRLCLAIE